MLSVPSLTMSKNPQVEGDGVVADRGGVGSGGEFGESAAACTLSDDFCFAGVDG